MVQERTSTTPLGDAASGIPTFTDVMAAQQRLKGVAHRTPVITSRTADTMVGAELYFKAENYQRAGAFKFRGAYNAISALSADARNCGVIAYSSGNHAQGLAYAAQLLGVGATIIMPHDAPAAKVAATENYGAEIITYDRYSENREELGARIAHERGMTLIPPYDHPDVIAGQGTAALELFEEVGPLDVLLVCLGGGGLLAGSALSARALAPDCKVIGVELEAGNDGQQSLEKGEIIHIPVPRSIADGAIVTHLGRHNFPIIQSLVDRIVTVTDPQLIACMRFFAERMKMVVEPTGCLAAAAAMHGGYPCEGKKVGVIVSGGNVDLQSFSRFISM